VYDDDDEEEEEEEATDQPAAGDLSDPFPNLKDAFTLGLEALKLFYFEEDNPDQKFEVIHYQLHSFYLTTNYCFSLIL